jgi:transcriptional regulator with XRE-family HTH domain
VESLISELIKLRQGRGWSQEDLARKLGVSLNTVQRWEMDKNKPSKLAIDKIRALLKESKVPG